MRFLRISRNPETAASTKKRLKSFHPVIKTKQKVRLGPLRDIRAGAQEEVFSSGLQSERRLSNLPACDTFPVSALVCFNSLNETPNCLMFKNDGVPPRTGFNQAQIYCFGARS